jgi:hypothetical protein
MEFNIFLYAGGLFIGYYFLGRGTTKLLKYIGKIKKIN